MKVLYLDFGIIVGEDKRILEQYVDPDNFKQRKSFDEYYIEERFVCLKPDITLSVELLRTLSKDFHVRVFTDEIVLSERGI